MKIRLKLTLIFTAITTMILIGVSIAIYYFFSLYRQVEFFDRLKDRTLITAQVHLGEDELSAEALREVKKKYQQYLPDEVIGLFELGYSLSAIEDSLRIKLPPNFYEEIHQTKYIEIKSDERQAVAMYYHDNEGNFVILISAIDRFGIMKLTDLQKILIFCFFISVGIIFISGRFFSRQALKPITKIIKDVNQIELSNLHLRLDMDNSKDEIAELTTTFNRVLERLETSLEIQKNFISNASHELKNPLTAIIGEVDLMLDKERPAGEYKAALQTIAYEARRLDNLTVKLLNLAQTGFDEKTVLNDEIRVDELLLGIHEDINHLVPDNDIRINFTSIPEDDQIITLRGNKRLLHAALVNVLENACKFSDNQAVHVLVKANEDTITVNITDTGIGIAAQDLQNIFQPFYRANNARGYKGSGIGLSLTEKIVKMHRGEIQVNSTLGEGTEFMISFRQKATKV